MEKEEIQAKIEALEIERDGLYEKLDELDKLMKEYDFKVCKVEAAITKLEGKLEEDDEEEDEEDA